MKQFVIHLDNVDNLSRIGKALGKQNVQIVSIAGTTAFGICTIILCTDDEKMTKKQLLELNIPFSTQDVLIASLDNEPGAFGLFTQLLFDQGIGILSLYALRFTSNKAEYAFSVNEADFEKAQAFLDASGFLTSGKN
ncbi:MAG: hypothetical protein ACXACU_02505 [Candidatus Hodarchaeales archaeon]|jgi:hypothetical protein